MSDSARLSMLKGLGAEEFDTGQTEHLWAVFESEFNDPDISGIAVEGEITWIECRLSDKSAHQLVKLSKMKRVKTGDDYFVRRFEPSGSSGFLIIRLGK